MLFPYSLKGLTALSAIPPQEHENDFSKPAAAVYPELNALDKQMMITTINAIERLPDIRDTVCLTVNGLCKLDILDGIDQSAINEYNKAYGVGFEVDDMLETLVDLDAAEPCYEFGATETGYYNTYLVNIPKAMELRDRLFEEWNRRDLLVEGLNPDGTLCHAVTMEEFFRDPAKYMSADGKPDLSGLNISGYTMGNIDSDLPVVISAEDFETAAKAYLSHGNSLAEFI